MKKTVCHNIGDFASHAICVCMANIDEKWVVSKWSAIAFLKCHSHFNSHYVTMWWCENIFIQKKNWSRKTNSAFPKARTQLFLTDIFIFSRCFFCVHRILSVYRTSISVAIAPICIISVLFHFSFSIFSFHFDFTLVFVPVFICHNPQYMLNAKRNEKKKLNSNDVWWMVNIIMEKWVTKWTKAETKRIISANEF